MGSGSTRDSCNFALFISLMFIFSFTIHVSCFQYEVGGKNGWIKPDGSELETYNEWAEQNRFRVGDTLYFKYTNDSVLQVSHDDYVNCAENNPITKFKDGNTVFEIDHSGFYYFISGHTGNCQAGQKMIVWVIGVHHPSTTTAPAPSPWGPTASQDGGNVDSGSPSHQMNSTDSLTVTSILLNLFMGVVIILYLFME